MNHAPPLLPKLFTSIRQILLQPVRTAKYLILMANSFPHTDANLHLMVMVNLRQSKAGSQCVQATIP